MTSHSRSDQPLALSLLSRIYRYFAGFHCRSQPFAWIAAALGLFLAANLASAATVNFDIPAQAAPAALQLFVKQSGVEVLFLQDDLANVQTKEVKGELEPAAALNQLLAGTGFVAKQNAEKNFVVKKAPPVKSGTGSVKGNLARETGAPAEGVRVIIRETGQQTRTDSHGEYYFSAVEPGTYLLVATAEGYQPLHITDVVVKGGNDLSLSKEEMHVADAKLTLEPYVVTAQSVTQLEKFEVTGTKPQAFSDRNVDIPRGIDDVQPYYIFDSKTIDQSGATNLEEFLKQRLTMNTTVQTNSQQYLAEPGGVSRPPAGNTSSINLRGLGASSTLVLVNGRRVAGVNIGNGYNQTLSYGQPDINGIPMAAIDRVEVLPASASAIYGGSAIAGVINIILKKDYRGGELRTTYDNTMDTDAPIRNVDFNYGFSLEGGKTHVMVTGHYSDSKPLLLQDRADSTVQGIATILKNSGPLFFSGSPFPGATPNIVRLIGASLVFKDGTSLNSPTTFIPAGTSPTTSLADLKAGLLANAGTQNFNLAPGTGSYGLQNQIAYNARVKSLGVRFERQMTSFLDFFAEASTSSNEAFSQYSPISNTFFAVSTNAPTNPFKANFSFLPYVQLNMPSAESIPIVTNSRTRNLSVGLTARLPYDWRAELDYTWSGNDFHYSHANGYDSALNTDITSGKINPFVDTLKYPLDLDPYLTHAASSTSSSLNDLALRGSGPIFHLPWGATTLTAGIEHRSEGNSLGTYDLIFPITTANTTHLIFLPKSQSTDSGYAELSIPLVTAKNAITGIKSLEFQVAEHYDYYHVNTGTAIEYIHPNMAPFPLIEYSPATSAGLPFQGKAHYSSSTQTVGLKYKPTDDLTFRISFAKAFLPPSYDQLLLNPELSDPSTTEIIDPKTGTSYSGYRLRTGGNPNLVPENDKSWQIGLIYEPKEGLLKGLRADVEFYDIKQLDYITSLTAQQIVDNPAFASRVTRDAATGLISVIDTSLINANLYETNGFDFTVDYRRETSIGTFDLFAMATFIRQEKRQLAYNAPLLDYAGYVGSGGEAKEKANLTLTWQRQHFSAGWTAAWYGGYKTLGAPGDPYYNGDPDADVYDKYYVAQGGSWTIPSQIYHQLFAGYAFGNTPKASRGDLLGSWTNAFLSNLTIQVGVKNVFNKTPPFDSRFGPFFYSPFGDIRMRTYSISLRKAF